MIPEPTIKQFKNGFFPVDYLLFGFCALMISLSLSFYNYLNQPMHFIVSDIIILIALIVLISREDRRFGSFNFLLHSWFPVISLSVFYIQATAYDNLIFSETFDPLLQTWEHCLFGGADHFAGFPGNHLFIDELFHFFYFSYYLILFVPGLFIYSKRLRTFRKMIYVLTLMMLIHFAFFIIFPGDGPIASHDKLFNDGICFIPLMKFIYDVGGEQGGGAFPSTHVAATVLISLYTISEFRWRAWPILIFTIGVMIATVYCSYHYIIDALAGALTGTLFYFSGNYLIANRICLRPDVSELSPRQ